LNRLPELKQFVKYGGAESYQNVEVKFRRGSKAVLTIYQDGVEQERVELTAIKTQKELHQMMVNKNFVLKSQEDIDAIQQAGIHKEMNESAIKVKAALAEKQKREEILDEIKKFAESGGDVFSSLTQRIKQLKQEGGNDGIVRELEQERNRLIGQEMLIRQQQLDMADEAMMKVGVGSDEL
jgi:hypothetical protein